VLQPITEQQADDVSWCVIKFCRKWSRQDCLILWLKTWSNIIGTRMSYGT